MLTGYEQVRSIVCALVGDWEGARDVRLTLPETGVCSSAGVADTVARACCGPTGCEPRAEEPVPLLTLKEPLVQVGARASGGGYCGS